MILISISLFIACNNRNNELGLEKIGPNVSVVEADKLISKNAVVVLDVRTPEEIAEGKLANALEIDYRSDSFVEECKRLDRNKSYLVYCRSGRRSSSAIEKMKELGFKKLYNLEGGYMAWSEGKLK